ncbi:GrpB family protein [Limibacter armeniacum]|uniref:GrpB family protein n=1 Tax=Limibacter armeniacum TaxID=466084 RepID=UPI002FE63012
MEKRLEELTKQEWDTLFPVELVEYNPRWKLTFDTEQQKIIEKIGAKVIRVEHVGSTSIPNIYAKPYIDISIEISKKDLFNDVLISGLTALGYHYFRQAGNGSDYMVFVKGYKLNGDKAQIFHIHMCPSGHEMLNQISFRDYLRAHTKRAKEYEQLKLDLASKFRNDRVGYRMAKDGFVEETMKLIERRGKA